MQYYDFYRHYSVPAHKFQEARTTFSRALEDREEDQYYVDTTYGFPAGQKQVSFKEKVLQLVPWFLEGLFEQLFGYHQYKRSPSE
jgi:hypothetical protein